MKNLLHLKTQISAAMLAFCLFHFCAFARSNPLFVVRERVRQSTGTLCPAGRLVLGLSYSELTVSIDGQVQHAVWTVPACSDTTDAWKWAVPAGSKVQRFSLPPAELDRLKSFLNRSEVKQLQDFLNAGQGVGDYDIEIHRPSGVQRIPVFSLMPQHDSLKRDSTLLEVICEAKKIGRDNLPEWCLNLSLTGPVHKQ